MALKYIEYELNGITIEEISASLQDYLKELGTETRNVHRIRLTVEEMLLNIMEGLGGGITISVGIGRQLGRHVLRMRYKGPSCDPTKGSESSWSNNLMQTLGYYPAWSRRGGVNTVSLVLSEKKKRGSIANILIAVSAAFLLGLAGQLLPESTRLSINELLLTPLSEGYMGLMGTFAGLMIALTICSGIIGMGDSTNLERVGKRFLSRFIGLSFLVCAAAELVVLPFLNLNFSAEADGQGSPIGQITAMLFDMLPSNPIEPFQTGNTIQVIVIAAFIGVGLIAIGERGSRIRGLIDEGNALFQRIISFVCDFIPLFVFSVLLRLILSGETGRLLNVLKPLTVSVVLIVLIYGILFMMAALRLKCPPLLLIKKILPTFLVAFTTASSVSAMALGMETCEKKLGVEKSIVSFAYPLGMVLFLPSSIIAFMVTTCCFAESYSVAVSPAWLIIAVITVTMLLIAMPPVAGAGIMVITVLFVNLGIPEEALILAAAMDIVLDYLETSLDTTMQIIQITCVADRLGQVDREKLLKP